MTSFYLSLIALVLDARCKEPTRFHPLVGFGHCVSWCESQLNQTVDSPLGHFIKGVLALLVCVGVPLVVLSAIVHSIYAFSAIAGYAVEALMLYSCIGLASLFQHIQAIEKPLQAVKRGDISQLDVARHALSMIVSRDTASCDATQITVGALESLLENALDALFATLFWYWVLGIEGAILHRLVNTLDAMWGYKNSRFMYFGKAAARFDDLLGFIPARLLALSFSICGKTHEGLTAWRSQAKACKSPNGGPVMCAGAGALGITLGGKVIYQGKVATNVPMGFGGAPQMDDLSRARRLILHSLILWMGVYLIWVYFIG